MPIVFTDMEDTFGWSKFGILYEFSGLFESSQNVAFRNVVGVGVMNLSQMTFDCSLCQLCRCRQLIQMAVVFFDDLGNVRDCDDGDFVVGCQQPQKKEGNRAAKV